MKKLQQFKIFAFTYERLAMCNFNLNITPFEAELNEEVVALGDNECLRAIRRITNHPFSEFELNLLLEEKNHILKQANSMENKKRLKEINNEIRNLIFVPNIITIHIPKKNNYKKIGKDGFFINGKHYQRFICGAGHARTNRSLFVDSSIYNELEEILSLGLKDVTIIPAKWNAYFALTSSATYRVTEPRCVVIPDKEIVLNKLVDFVEEDTFQDKVIRKNMDLNINLWDGQGLISPRMARKWCDDLDLDYVSGAYCVRAPFTKGMLCVMDFHKFAREVAHKEKIKDIYGKEYNIEDIDVILSQSQFKLWNCFSSWEEYCNKLKEKQISWGISKAMPDYEHEMKYYLSNYQFLQVLNLDNENIKGLCKQTTDWLRGIKGEDYNQLILYLLGKAPSKYPFDCIFEKCNNPMIKALLIQPCLMKDSYVRDVVDRSIKKREKESCLGKIVLNGNFECTISDPYGQMEHAFGLEVKGLLGEGQSFSSFWNRKGVSKIASQRAPLTWKSEVVVFDLLDNERTREWFNYLTTGIVFNLYGVEPMLEGGMDFDLDLTATTDNKYLINGKYMDVSGIPVTYTPQKAKKVKLNKKTLWSVDMLGFNQKIGSITNNGSTIPEMQSMYEVGSPEWCELETRWKLVCKLQSVEIDSQKGLEKKPIYKHWLTRMKTNDDMTQEEKDFVEFNNKLVIDKRPYFMRYLYSDYNKEYKDHVADFDRYCLTKYNCRYKEIPEDFKNTQEYQELKSYYDYKSPLFETYGTMNRICYHMEKAIKDIKTYNKKAKDEELFHLLSIEIPIDNEKLDKLLQVYEEYLNFKRSKMLSESEFSTYDQYYKYLRNRCLEDISNSFDELSNLAIYLCYFMKKKKEFAWNVFGQGIVNILIEKRIASGDTIIKVPQKNDNGEIEYLGEKYSFVPFNLVENDQFETDFSENIDEDLFDMSFLDEDLEKMGDFNDNF